MPIENLLVKVKVNKWIKLNHPWKDSVMSYPKRNILEQTAF